MKRKGEGRGLLSAVPGAGTDAIRRAIFVALLRRFGRVRLTRGFARALGLRRRDLRASIRRWQEDGEPMLRVGRKLVIGPVVTTRLVLDLDKSALTTLVAALRNARDGSHTRRQLVEAAQILHRIGGQLPPERFELLQALGGFDLMPQVLDEDGRPTTSTHNLLVRAMREEHKVAIRYIAQDGSGTERVILPLTLTHHRSCVLAWCEARNDFRTFRLSSIGAPEPVAESWPRSREAYLNAWRQAGGRDPADNSD